jgi:hypothetical protein
MKMIKNTGVPMGKGHFFRDEENEFSTVADAAYSAEAAAKAGP